MRYTDSDECRDAGVTYHLVPKEVWEQQREQSQYVPEAFAEDGFIHCTNGLVKLVDVGNMFYTGDPRAFQVLILKMSKLQSPVRYDDPDELFPHIYGPLNSDAVVGMFDVRREGDGTFLPYSIGSEPKS